MTMGARRYRVALGSAALVAGLGVGLPAAPSSPEASPAVQRGAGAPPAATRPAPTGQRGRGGRGGVQVMTLTTPAWTDGEMMPAKHTQAGGDVSPSLAWTGAPDGVASFVLVAHDLDAAVAGGADDLLHWMVWNIPGTAPGLPEGVDQGSELPDGARQISVSGPYYRGPGAPASGPVHHYVFELFALDAMLNVPAVGASPADTRAAVRGAMMGHVRAKGVLVGRYKRTP